MTNVPIPKKFIDLATQWHGGQDSFLYAVSSSGGLTIGTDRPYDNDAERYLTDDEWHLRLWQGLESEVRDCYRYDASNSLARFLKFCEETVATLRTTYRLENSEVV